MSLTMRFSNEITADLSYNVLGEEKISHQLNIFQDKAEDHYQLLLGSLAVVL